MGPIQYLGTQIAGFGNWLYGFSSNNGIQRGVTGNGFFVPVGTANSVITLQDHYDFENAFFNCSTLQAVITNKGQCKINGTWDLYKNGSEKPCTNARAMDIKAKMAKPNVLQTYAQFRMDVSIYVAVHGWCLLWWIPNGSPFGTGFQNIWALNPADLVITYKQGKYLLQTKLEDIIESIKFNYAGGQIDVPLKEVSFVKDQVATKSSRGLMPPIVPTSRIYGLKMVVSNNMAAYDARNSLATNRGPQGILVNQSKDAASFIQFSEEDQAELNKQIQEYGILRGQTKMPMTGKDLRYIATGIPTKDLMLFEETEETMRRICDIMGYPVGLLATENGKSIGDQGGVKKQDRATLYQNTIIPEDLNEMPCIFSKFDLEKDGLEVKTDYSHIDDLKEDEIRNEQIITSRVGSIDVINKMPVDYVTKVNIAIEMFNISIEDAKKIISDKIQDANPNPAGQVPAV